MYIDALLEFHLTQTRFQYKMTRIFMIYATTKITINHVRATHDTSRECFFAKLYFYSIDVNNLPKTLFKNF